MFATVRFTTDLGAEVHVPVSLPTDAQPWKVEEVILDTMRLLGRRGWRAAQIPPGGYCFPLNNHSDFDWALIGGRPGQKKFDNENAEREGVWVSGEFYSRRDYAETQPKRGKGGMPAAIRYSRGARPTDPPELREKGDGDFEYVTIVNFRGGLTRRKKLALRGGTPPAAKREDGAEVEEDSGEPGDSTPATQAEHTSALEPLEDTPAHLKAVVDFIRESNGKFASDTTLTIEGVEHNLLEYTRTNWDHIKGDFALAVAIALRLEAAAGRHFEIPAGV